MEILQKPVSTQIAEYVRSWGGPASITFLDSGYQFFSDPSIDGFIGYREEYSCAVVMGDPLTTEDNKISRKIYLLSTSPYLKVSQKRLFQ